MKATIGNADVEVKIVDARIMTDLEQGGHGPWLSGIAHISGDHDIDVTAIVGCWTDTNDDKKEWRAAYEGGAIVAAVVTGESITERGFEVSGLWNEIWPDMCESIGADVCEALREAAYPIMVTETGALPQGERHEPPKTR